MEAIKKLHKEDPSLDLYNLNGGIEAWKLAGEPLSCSGKKIIPLERQIQITAGSIILLGYLMGTFMHPKFLWIPAFIGGGLIFAGITGWCGMGIVLSKMPWNK
jgi:hypothetical protein